MAHETLMKSLVSGIMAVILSSCADSKEESENQGPTPSGPVLPAPEHNNQNNGSTQNLEWSFLRLEKHKEVVDPECRNTIDVFTVQANGDFLLTECGGTTKGVLDRKQKSQIEVWTKLATVSNMNREICAEASPMAETYLNVIFANGIELPLYQELTDKGLCSWGDRRAALSLYRTLLNMMEDIP